MLIIAAAPVLASFLGNTKVGSLSNLPPSNFLNILKL